MKPFIGIVWQPDGRVTLFGRHRCDKTIILERHHGEDVL